MQSKAKAQSLTHARLAGHLPACATLATSSTSWAARPPFNGTSGNFEVHGVDVKPHKHHKDDDNRRKFELSDWERYVREHGFLIPVFLFALLLVGNALYRQTVSRRPAVSPHPYERLEVAGLETDQCVPAAERCESRTLCAASEAFLCIVSYLLEPKLRECPVNLYGVV